MSITINHGEKTLTFPHIMQLDLYVFEKFQETQKLARAASKLQKKLEGLEEKLEELSKVESSLRGDAADKLKETVKEEYLKVNEELQDKAADVTDATLAFIKSLIKRYPEYEVFTRGYSIGDHKDLIGYLGKETGEFEFVSGSEDFLV